MHPAHITYDMKASKCSFLSTTLAKPINLLVKPLYSPHGKSVSETQPSFHQILVLGTTLLKALLFSHIYMRGEKEKDKGV